MIQPYDEIVEFIASGPSPLAVSQFQVSQTTKDYVADLIHKEKTVGLSAEESKALDNFLQFEHLMRLAKARARMNCSQ
jgi:hypothetical protein